MATNIDIRFCKMCDIRTRHLDLGGNVVPHLRFKCTMCGEYNEISREHNEDQEILKDNSGSIKFK